jgi:hypothetical protein
MEHILPASIEHLHSWLLGLPWVVERPGMVEAPGMRWFAVDCEPLGRRRLWLLTGALGGTAADELGVHLVVPAPVARRIVAAGDGRVVAPIQTDHRLVSLHLDAAHGADIRDLERVLLRGYHACFT